MMRPFTTPKRTAAGRAGVAIALAGLALIVVSPGARGDEPHDRAKSAEPHEHSATQHDHSGASPHVHVAVPAGYRGAHPARRTWTDRATIARGREIYEARCASCHGARGDGQGPAAQSLPLKPPDFTDRHMVDEMAPDYWFWRVSEGGQVEPYKSQGSAMPPWKQELSVGDRWAVIAYQHALSGHRGPHATSEHGEMPGAPVAPR
jgi:mono/diheme cytochrome c family protein